MSTQAIPGSVPVPSRSAWARPWLLCAAAVLLWQAASAVDWGLPQSLPEPWVLAKSLVLQLASNALWQHVYGSALHAASGLALGAGLALLFGLIAGRQRLASTLLAPVVLWLAAGEEAQGVLVSFGAFLPIYVHTSRGIRNIDPALIEMARSCGLSGAALYRQVVLPGALPAILTGVRLALGVMWLVLIATEVASTGLGTVAYAALAALGDALVRSLQRWCLRWHPAYRAAAA